MSEMEKVLERLTSLEHELARQKAVTECQNLMGKYAFWHSVNMHEEKNAIFAGDHEDFRAEIFGAYQGPGSFDRYVKGHTYMGKDYDKGTIRMHALTTPVIEVAADGKSARGAWICPGYETGKFPKTEGATEADDFDFDCKWAWMKYGCDFILTDDGWKILHLHVYGLFQTGYYESWADQDLKKSHAGPPPGPPSDEDIAKLPPEEQERARLMKSYMPNAPETHKTWHYARDLAPENFPAPPEPYNTWADLTETY